MRKNLYYKTFHEPKSMEIRAFRNAKFVVKEYEPTPMKVRKLFHSKSIYLLVKHRFSKIQMKSFTFRTLD